MHKMMMLEPAGTHTISNKTWSTIAAAPLNPPPKARFRAPLRSNCMHCQLSFNTAMSTCGLWDAHINILGIYPPLDEDGKHERSEDRPQYPPEPPAPGALRLILRRLQQCGLFVLILSLVARGGEQGRLLRVGVPSRPGGGPRRRFCRG